MPLSRVGNRVFHTGRFLTFAACILIALNLHAATSEDTLQTRSIQAANDSGVENTDLDRTSPEALMPGRIVRHGVIVDFEAVSAGNPAKKELMEGRFAEIRFRLTEEATGRPVSGITPGAWMDIGMALAGQPVAEQKSCKEKIGLYLRGAVGIRPMIDLNSYYVVVLNNESSVSIIDPLVSMAGTTSTLATVPLKSRGVDWARSADEKRIYISMQNAGEVAVLDTDSFKLTANIDAGANPTRVVLQPDGRYLWIGNNTDASETSGVTVVDTETLTPAGFVATGEGHHEIVFTDDSRYAFVSNRDTGNISVIDVQERRKIRDIKTGQLPISLAFSALARTLYVADGKRGVITVIDGEGHTIVREIEAKPGLGPMRTSPDGRYVMVVNPVENSVFVVDTATNAIVHTITVEGKPYQIYFSRAFAYIRALASERVSMINLSSLGEGKKPIVQSFAAGSVPPHVAGDLPLADSVASTSSEAAVFVVNPADNTTYFYMEGMNAPSSNYQVYGSSARAVTVVDRNLREVKPGLYVAKVRLPAAGRYDVAFLLDTPQLLHCFSAEVKPNPAIRHELASLAIEYLQQNRQLKIGTPTPFRFKLTEPLTGRPVTGLTDVSIVFFRVPGRDRTQLMAEEEGDGIYRVILDLPSAGAYYVYVGVRSKQVGYQDLPYFTLVASSSRAHMESVAREQ